MFYPIENEHFKNRITMSNRYMIDDSDLVIAYVDMKFNRSGAKKSFSYASKTKKVVIIFF